MPAADSADLLAALSELRADLAEQAVALDCQRRPDAADVALTLAARLAEISDRFSPDDGAPDRAPGKSPTRRGGGPAH